MITNVTILALVVMTLLLDGSHSMVFAQSSNFITSQIEEAEQKINDSLDESQERIGHLDGGLQNIGEVDIKWILFFTDLFALN